MKRDGGYTLIEIAITLVLTTILVAATGGIVVQTARAWDQNDDRTALSSSMRAAEERMYFELAQATLVGNATSVPAVTPLTLNANPGNIITFQRPLDVTGKNWTPAITYRLRNEDTNGNLILDAAEDANGNKILDRVVERLQDLNGDGLLTGPGETVMIARDIDNLTFTQNGSLITVTMTGRRRIGETGGNVFQRDAFSFTVNVSN